MASLHQSFSKRKPAGLRDWMLV